MPLPFLHKAFDHHMFMTMKGKKKEKLAADDAPMMDLSESCDSSISSDKSISSGD